MAGPADRMWLAKSVYLKNTATKRLARTLGEIRGGTLSGVIWFPVGQALAARI